MFCCERLNDSISHKCKDHPYPNDCPDKLIDYNERFDEYGLIVRDGGSSSISIEYCPFCGKKFPESKRDRWFEELEELGFDNPSTDDIPDKYKSNRWYLK